MARATELLMAKAQSAQLIETVDNFVDNDTRETGSTARVARSGYGTLPVYKLTPSGVERIEVAVQSIHEVLTSPGYSATCFDCGLDECGPGVNDCPGRPPRLFRICPVTSCRKPVYDSQPTGKHKVDEFDTSGRPETDKNAIVDDAYSLSTPESRTKAAMDLHLIGFHPAESMSMGISRPRELPTMQVVS